MFRPRKSQSPNNGPKNSSFIPTRHCKQLEKDNFHSYLSDKKAAFVMFYNPDCKNCHKQAPHFQKVATELAQQNKVFAAVDCSVESDLCAMERVRKTPEYKLYVGGKYLNEFRGQINAYDMIRFVENTPEAPPPPEPWPRRKHPRGLPDRERFDSDD